MLCNPFFLIHIAQILLTFGYDSLYCSSDIVLSL